MKDPAGSPQLQDDIFKPCARKKLMQLYGVSYYILSKWLKSIVAETGPLKGRYFTSAQLKVIYDQLGYPGEK